MHVVQRGINRNRCFFEDGDFRMYLEYLRTFSQRFDCSIHAYCLMPNHIHLLLTPHGANACALLMKNLGQQYVQKVNYRLGRTGTLWEGRFFSSLATSERYILNCYRYIDRNPVRAGIVPAPGDYGWSSYAANAEGKRDGLLRPHVAYDGLAVEPQERLRTYRELCDQDPPQAVLDEIRKATRVGGVIGKRRRQRGRPPKAK